MKKLLGKLTGRRRWVVLGAVAALLLGGAATATAAVADDGHDDDKTIPTSSGREENDDDNGKDDDANEIGDDGVAPVATTVTLEQAANTAATEVGGGVVYEIDLDGTAEAPRWKVHVYGADGQYHEVTVDANNGEVTRHEVDNDD
ncbi:PepSY domain-containing protein [Phytomonospora endophytica]|uniref:Putative membrane protein YkoI n=1 Tax=Phytomonospora endophytica TaxID=714109 RepID=A0A841FU44_9ACTN|nr:PepSY domain-containing protein [Phytomonospora endophytica]MBB6037258.1 putative membrane protein YkoI [Phytomonospora endophytica]GIG71241.1 hypothetical protein Pen01_75360 [Phytomonospora endophytica]